MTHDSDFSPHSTPGVRKGRLVRGATVLGALCLGITGIVFGCSPANQEGTDSVGVKGQFATTGAVVHVNQVGYLPGADKVATVVNVSTSGLSFEVVDTSTNSSVFSGTTTVVGTDPASNQHVHHADFSSVKAAGTYLVRVGTDESYPFEIGLDVFTDDVKGMKLYKQALKYFYFHRMGVALHADHLTDFADAGHQRIAVHPYDDDVTGLNDWTRRNGTDSHLFDIKHAWGDAGDFGHYAEADAAASWFLMNMYERYSSSFTDGDLNLPESGNGIPDLLDEIIYGAIADVGMLPHPDLDWATISSELGSNDDKAYLAAHKCHNSTWWGYVKAEEWWYEPGNLAGHFTPLGERDCNHPYMTTALATATTYCSDEKARPRYCMESSTGATFNIARKLAHLARLVAPYENSLQDPASFPTAVLTDEFTDALHGAPSATNMDKMKSANLWALAKKAYKRASEIDNGVWVNNMPAGEDTLPTSSHNTTFGGGPYNDGSQSDDQYAAAAEMFMTAVELEPAAAGTYRTDVVGSSHYKEMKRFDWEKDGPMATLSLLTAADFGSNTSTQLPTADKTTMENKVLAYADFIKSVATDPNSTDGENQGYPSSVPSHANSTYGWPDADGEDNAESDVFADQPEYVWGSNKHIVHGMIVLGYAYEISNDKSYLKAAHRMMDYLMGQNPLGVSYITGWGDDAWKTTHDRWALNRFGQAAIDYPSGWLVGGPMSLEALCGNEESATPRTGSKATRMASNDIAGAEDGWCSIENTLDWNAPLAFASFLVTEKHKNALAGTCSTNADCNDGNVCTTDTCGAGGSCVYTDLGSSTTCTDDGSSCTDDVCGNGVCTHPDNGTCGCVSDSDCDDGNVCTTDTCGAGNSCVFSNNTANCLDDGDSCTNDVCSAGSCTHPANGTCGGGNSATGDIKIKYFQASTDDNDNAIKPHLQIHNTGSTSVDLSDLEIRYYFTAEAYDNVNNPVVEHCDYAAIACTNVILDHESMGAAVTNADTYVSVKFAAGAGSLAGGTNTGNIQIRWNMKKWNNLNETNDYSYDANATSFVETGDITLYQNGTLIWGTEPGSGTSNGDCTDVNDTGPCADDGDSCTNDVCSNGVCTHPDNGSCTPQCTTSADCNDGNACTDDICQAGVCSNPTMNCDDGISCTVDSCSAGSCVSDTAACECSTNADCNDSNECTTDTCTANYQCSNANKSNGSSCSDGQSCTTESCQSGTCTVTDSSACGCTTNADCSDGNACTDDICDTGTGTCSNPAMVCDDGVSCTVDSCSAGACVVDSNACECSTNADCNDNNQCTANTCDSQYTCQTANYDSTVSCSTDSLSCTTETCDGNGACGNFNDTACECSVDADCNDGNECTQDSCGADRMCDHPYQANGTACSTDNDSCTDDICTSGACTHPDNGTCSTDPCANPTPITSNGNYNVDGDGTCFSYTGGTHGVMPSVMNTNNNTSAATTIEWHGGTDQNVTSCSNLTQHLNGNGAQLNSFVVDEDASGVAYFTVKSQNSNTYQVQVSVQNWQNGSGCN